MLGLGLRLFAAYRQVANVIAANLWNNIITHWEDETENWEDIG